MRMELSSSVHCALFLLLLAPVIAQAGDVGFCYGTNADDLPSPQSVAELLTKNNIAKVRIYSYNASIVQAFADTDVEVIITIPNEELENFQEEGPADEWVTNNLLPLVQSVKITVVTVGVEVPILHPEKVNYVLPAMLNIHTGLTKANLASQIRVSTAHSMAMLKTSFPPSTGCFNDSIATSYMKPILDFLKATGSFYMVNAYPFHAYMIETDNVALDYALFEPKEVVVDPNTNLTYTGMLLAQVDAVYFALEAMGHRELSVMVSETGWPTKGDSDEKVANVQNAATYINNLVALVQNNTGTPHKPGQPLSVFIFSLFDEDKKPGKGSERHWGVFDVSGNSYFYLGLSHSQGGSPGGSPQSFNGTGGTWCVAVPSASNESLKAGLNFACGSGNVDCSPIQKGQPCFYPDTFVNHASYAYNSYYQRSGDNTAACDFGGTAMITTTNPSYGSCVFPTDALASAITGPGGQCCGLGEYSASWSILTREKIWGIWTVTLVLVSYLL